MKMNNEYFRIPKVEAIFEYLFENVDIIGEKVFLASLVDIPIRIILWAHKNFLFFRFIHYHDM